MELYCYNCKLRMSFMNRSFFKRILLQFYKVLENNVKTSIGLQFWNKKVFAALVVLNSTMFNFWELLLVLGPQFGNAPGLAFERYRSTSYLVENFATENPLDRFQ